MGYFPSYCVQLFNSKSPTTVHSTTSQSPSSTHQQTSPSSYFNGNNNGNNKMVSFVRDLLHHRPKLLMQHRSVTPKCGQTFGVDLVEYLESVGQTGIIYVVYSVFNSHLFSANDRRTMCTRNRAARHRYRNLSSIGNSI